VTGSERMGCPPELKKKGKKVIVPTDSKGEPGGSRKTEVSHTAKEQVTILH